MSRIALAALVGVFSIPTVATGDTVNITGIEGDPFSLSSKTMAKLIPNGGVINDTKLGKLHKKLKQHGIKTNGRVTFLLAQTNNGGLSLVTLVDKQKTNPSGSDDPASLAMVAEASSSIGLVQGEDADFGVPEINGETQSLVGDFSWNANGTGDAFAWTQLDHSDSGTFEFAVDDTDPSTFPGLKEMGTFQFITWTDDGWEVVHVGDFSEGVFSFSFSVAPVPPALALGLAGLLGVAAIRRFKRPSGDGENSC